MGKKANDDPALLAEIKSLYDGGFSFSMIQKHFGFSKKKTQNIIKRSGAKARTKKEAALYGDKNPNWKGDKAGYTALHDRITVRKGKANRCDRCGILGAKSYHWANMTGNYHDLDDYTPMCQKCHFEYDRVWQRALETKNRGEPSPKDKAFPQIVDREFAGRKVI